MKNLSKEEIEDILYLSKQGNGRWQLICNLYKIEKETLYKILKTY